MKIAAATYLIASAAACALPQITRADSERLDVPLVQQTHSEWCWSADASAVLRYRGVTTSQCRIANWVDSIDYACGAYPFYWNDRANSANYLGGTTGIEGILWWLGRRASRYYNSPLSYGSTRSAIQRGNPVVALWSWPGGGGHFIVIDGFDDASHTLYFMNPWPGEGVGYGDYDWVKNGAGDIGLHSWVESLIAY